MFLESLIGNPIGAIFFLISIVTAVSVHEFSHAKAAQRLGDPTAELAGRLTLNPKAHLDPIGSLLFLIAGFGWGKAVPFDAFNLENPRRDAGIISLAGPMSNFVVALISAVLFRLLILLQPAGIATIGFLFFPTFIWVNIILGAFNLIPIHPLDGFKIVGAVLSERSAEQWYELERYGLIFLVFIIFPFAGGRSVIDIFLIPFVQGFSGLLIP